MNYLLQPRFLFQKRQQLRNKTLLEQTRLSKRTTSSLKRHRLTWEQRTLTPTNLSRSASRWRGASESTATTRPKGSSFLKKPSSTSDKIRKDFGTT